MSPGESHCASLARSFERLYQEASCYESHEKHQILPKAGRTSKRDISKCLNAAERLVPSRRAGAPTSDVKRGMAGSRNNAMRPGMWEHAAHPEFCSYHHLFFPHGQKILQENTQKNIKA